MTHFDFVDSIWVFGVFSQRLTLMSLTLFGFLGFSVNVSLRFR